MSNLSVSINGKRRILTSKSATFLYGEFIFGVSIDSLWSYNEIIALRNYKYCSECNLYKYTCIFTNNPIKVINHKISRTTSKHISRLINFMKQYEVPYVVISPTSPCFLEYCNTLKI